jgi:hypothetical protein
VTDTTSAGELVECHPRWFDCIEHTDHPWRHWLRSALYARRRASQGHAPLDAWIEHDVDELIERADRVRLSIAPETTRFADMWATFHGHHMNLETSYGYRRTRYLTWRGAALTLICQRDCFQDVVDRNMARELLAATMREHGPYNPDGSDRFGGNFWRVTTCPNTRRWS